MKKVISLLLATVLVLSMMSLPVFAAEPAYFSFDVSATTVDVNEEITVTVKTIEQRMCTFAASLYYDPAKFDLVSLVDSNGVSYDYVDPDEEVFPTFRITNAQGNNINASVEPRADGTGIAFSGLHSDGKSYKMAANNCLAVITLKAKVAGTTDLTFKEGWSYVQTASQGGAEVKQAADTTVQTETITINSDEPAETVTVTTASRADKKVTWNVAVTASLMQAGKVSAKAYVPNTELSDTTALSLTDTVLTAITGDGVATFNVFTTLDTDTYLETTELEVTANGVTGSSAN